MKKTNKPKINKKVTKVLLKIAKSGFGTKLYIDGKLVPNCTDVVIHASARGVSSVTLKLINIEAEVDGEALVTKLERLPPEFKTYENR
jgi:hypothetical protein